MAVAVYQPHDRFMPSVAVSLCAVLAWCVAATASAQCVAAPELFVQVGAVATTTWRDRVGRVVAPIHVNGEGPFPFVVDTGANRSALSHQLAERLRLVATGSGEVHSVTDVTIAPLVARQRLGFGTVALDAGVMPLLDRDVLGEAHGLLGVDAMSDRRLLVDFERGCVEIAPSLGARRLRGWQRVRGRLRFGNLVVIEGAVDRVRVHMLVDTGSASTLANTALYNALSARARRRVESGVRAYTAGDPIIFDTAVHLPRLQIGDVRVSSVTAFVGDFHVFEVWRLANEPTLLIGMDVLSQTQGIAIDYRQAAVYFRIEEPPPTGTRVRAS